MSNSAPIFTKTYDLLTWLIPHTLHFPRSQRFVVTRRLQDAALDFQEHIIEANRAWGAARVTALRQADADLDKVRLYLRLAACWEWLNEGQYRHVSLMVQEIGNTNCLMKQHDLFCLYGSRSISDISLDKWYKMLGGWIKKPHGAQGASHEGPR